MKSEIGGLKSEIGELISFYSLKLNKSYSDFLGKGVFGKRLKEFLAETHEIDKKDLIDFQKLGVRLKDGSPDVPEKYEDWAAKNPIKK